MIEAATINYVEGDARDPVRNRKGPHFIAHVCNDEGGWGSGFAKAVSERWPEPEAKYRAMTCRILGHVDGIKVESDLTVLNIIGQCSTLGDGKGRPSVRYSAIAKGFRIIRTHIEFAYPAGILHMPRLGCGLAGGSWAIVEQLIYEVFLYDNVCPVYVYDFPGGEFNP